MDWFTLLNWPIISSEIIILVICALFWGLVRKPANLIATSFCALFSALIIMAAQPNISPEGVFLFNSFIANLLTRSIGDIIVRYIILFIGIALMRRFAKQFMPKKLFAK